MPNFHRFTIKAQEALQNAQDIAAQKNHGELKALHLLAALLEDEQSLVVPVLERLGVNVEKLDEQTRFRTRPNPADRFERAGWAVVSFAGAYGRAR